ncbi:MAG TPA: M48 family peptidase [Mariniphaga anaerophila]|uniref:M48 family peptidase n=1 Tax=Mariniphaga anaerophila TaxID=1484053 RepID=A0A831LMX6_9BACT|nr:M48 family peptidase [Mariniphaga anaerophila]
MPNKVVHFKSIGPVTFFRNRRSKSIKISVKPDKSVLVSFPFFVSEKEVLSFLARNEVWIRKQQEKAVALRKVYGVGEIIQTRLHQVELCHGKTEDVETTGKVVKVFSPDFNSEKAWIFLEDILNQVYRYEARKLLPPRLNELAQLHKFRYNKVSIRNNKRNWGSCSSRNNISLNLQMMKLPDPLIDYILLHELVHTEIKNHSDRFWEKLDQVTGDKARELAKEVKKYSTYTL